MNSKIIITILTVLLSISVYFNISTYKTIEGDFEANERNAEKDSLIISSIYHKKVSDSLLKVSDSLTVEIDNDKKENRQNQKRDEKNIVNEFIDSSNDSVLLSIHSIADSILQEGFYDDDLY